MPGVHALYLLTHNNPVTGTITIKPVFRVYRGWMNVVAYLVGGKA